jgi:hypothetical protein
MNNLTAQIIITGVLFVIKMVLGYVMGHIGKPYQPVLLAFHKLISLATGIMIAVIVAGFLKKRGADTLKIAAVVASGVFFIAAFATGALQSALKDTVNTVLVVHKIAPILALLSTGAAVYLFLK